MNRTFLMAFAVLGCVSGRALAADKDRSYHPDAAFDKCMSKAETTIAYGECTGALLTREEARLNAAWKAVYPPLAPEAKAVVLAEQRQWVSYKDKSCSYEFDFAGSNGRSLTGPLCRAEIVGMRTRYLKEMVEE